MIFLWIQSSGSQKETKDKLLCFYVSEIRIIIKDVPAIQIDTSHNEAPFIKWCKENIKSLFHSEKNEAQKKLGGAPPPISI